MSLPRHKKCIRCRKLFIGSIDPTRRFCSTECKDTEPKVVKKNNPPNHKKSNKHNSPPNKPTYPFTCRRCKEVITEGRKTKAHKKRLCVLRCNGVPKKPKEEKYTPQWGKPDIEPKEDTRLVREMEKIIRRREQNRLFSKKAEIIAKKKQKIYGKSFYTQPKWIELRLLVIKKYGKRCMRCGKIEENPHIDHIKPRVKYPYLEFNFDNLQVLCRSCNKAKGWKDETDWRGNSKFDKG